MIDIKEKIKQTNLKIYGFKNPSQNIDIKEKKKITCLKNHGVESPSQNKIIHDKIMKSGLKIKKYKLCGTKK